LALNATRKAPAKKAKCEHEVHWDDVIRVSRVPRVSRSTASRALKKEAINVEWRRPREKPSRTADHIKERLRICEEWKDKPRVALSIPSEMVKKAVAGMKKRAQAIYDAKGHDIEID
jgi:hypothetical protein